MVDDVLDEPTRTTLDASAELNALTLKAVKLGLVKLDGVATLLSIGQYVLYTVVSPRESVPL